MKTIVISAVNLNKGGTLTILRNCLAYLSTLAEIKGYRIVAVVFNRELADYPNIEYIETSWPKKRWINRLWFEYVMLKRISSRFENIDLWLSLHDTTPNVRAKRQAVYCHNPFPFYRWDIGDCLRAPKIVLLSLLSKWVYRMGIHKNEYVIVQQQWLKNEFGKLFDLSSEKIIISIPDKLQPMTNLRNRAVKPLDIYTFIYAAAPDSHKNFESICRAVEILEKEGNPKFKVYITCAGVENAYAKWLYRRWGKLKSLSFIGFQTREALFTYYEQSDCLIFPSKVETWGLPISEFAAFNKPMLLADFSYAYETAAGTSKTAFFDPARPKQLAFHMRNLIKNDMQYLVNVPEVDLQQPLCQNWSELFDLLLKNTNN